MRKGFTLLEAIVTIALMAVITWVSMIALRPVQKGSLVDQTISAERTIGRVVMQLRIDGVNVSNGTYTPDSFFSRYHVSIPEDPLSYPAKPTHWYINGYKIYPVNYVGQTLTTYDVNGQNKTVYYDISTDYPLFFDYSDKQYEPSSTIKENYSMVGQNLVKNGDFSQGFLFWSYDNGTPSLSVVSTPQNGNVNYCLRMDGDTKNNFATYQDIHISGKAGDTFRVSYRAKPMYITQDSWYGCEVYIHYTDGGYSYQGQWHPNRNDPQWQEGTVTVKASKDYDYIRVYLLLYKANGYTLFDDISITKLSSGM